MSIRDVMLEQLSVARRIVTDGHEVVPVWRIGTPDGDWLILTRFDPDKPGQLDRAIHLIKRFSKRRSKNPSVKQPSRSVAPE